jgi:hypothetical protein
MPRKKRSKKASGRVTVSAAAVRTLSSTIVKLKKSVHKVAKRRKKASKKKGRKKKATRRRTRR